MPPDDGPVLLLVNPTSGGGRGVAAGEQALALLSRAGHDVRRLVAPTAERLRADASAALRDGARAVIVVGGDGMVHLGTTLVAGTEVCLGVVAAGSGNDNARELGLPVRDTPRAVRAVDEALRSGRSRAVDAARWGGEGGTSGWFAGVLGAGFDSLVNERANGWPRLRGRWRYDLAVLRELPVFTPREYVVVLDGVRHELSAVLVAVGNGPAYGGGMQICAGARTDDGLLDVVIAGPMSRRALVRLYPKVFRGTHLDHPAVVRHRVRTVELGSPGIVAYADGERLGELPLRCEVVPGAVRLLADDHPVRAG
jgi:diacylglycerol kinase (ATP)